jgi:anti-sigma regulatory factor (Ser/Thr protein kinase)
MWRCALRTIRIPAAAPGAARLRSIMRADLAVLPSEVTEDAAVVATELLGNALRHARSLDDGTFAVTWGVGDLGLEIAVTDGGGPTTPHVEQAHPTATSGRGLSIVEQLSAEWGVERDGDCTTVWAIVPCGSRGSAG